MARLFFALWPDPAAALALASLSTRLAGEAQGKPVPEAKIHLTLAFLGEVDAGRLDVAHRAAGTIRASAFTASVDRVGSFRGARVAWAGMSRVAPALAVQGELELRLRESRFELDDRPFVPHVTLAREIRRAVEGAPIDPIAWEARSLALVRSETGTGRYSILQSWEFARYRGATRPCC